MTIARGRCGQIPERLQVSRRWNGLNTARSSQLKIHRLKRATVAEYPRIPLKSRRVTTCCVYYLHSCLTHLLSLSLSLSLSLTLSNFISLTFSMSRRRPSIKGVEFIPPRPSSQTSAGSQTFFRVTNLLVHQIEGFLHWRRHPQQAERVLKFSTSKQSAGVGQ
jgi:hypothetical protein